MYVERFVKNEIRNLSHGDDLAAEVRFKKFVKQGAEIIAVAAMLDVQTTLQIIAMQVNYRLVARSGSASVQEKCAALLEAIAEVPTQAERFIKEVDMEFAEAAESSKRGKEEKAERQR